MGGVCWMTWERLLTVVAFCIMSLNAEHQGECGYASPEAADPQFNLGARGSMLSIYVHAEPSHRGLR